MLFIACYNNLHKINNYAYERNTHKPIKKHKQFGRKTQHKNTQQ